MWVILIKIQSVSVYKTNSVIITQARELAHQICLELVDFSKDLEFKAIYGEVDK